MHPSQEFHFCTDGARPAETSGIYGYLQHPSYTGLVIFMVSNMLLLARMDGTLSCWISPSWYDALRYLRLMIPPLAWSMFFYGVGTWVNEEERMLKAKFGKEWEE